MLRCGKWSTHLAGSRLLVGCIFRYLFNSGHTPDLTGEFHLPELTEDVGLRRRGFGVTFGLRSAQAHQRQTWDADLAKGAAGLACPCPIGHAMCVRQHLEAKGAWRLQSPVSTVPDRFVHIVMKRRQLIHDHLCNPSSAFQPRQWRVCSLTGR